MSDKYKPKHLWKFTSANVCSCGKTPIWGICKLICESGQVKYPWYCRQCGKRTNVYEPKHSHLIYTFVFDESGDVECERCGIVGAELHHWAPSKLFADEADKWPTSFLCQLCHSRWHTLVTPRLNEAI